MDYPLIDMDGHYYEPDDAFTRHIEAEYKDRTVRVERNDRDEFGRIFVGDDRTFMSVMPGDHASAPGALQGLFAGGVADGFTHKDVVTIHDHPEFVDKVARLKLMDEQGLQATVMLPTMGVAVEEDLSADTDLLYASLRSFNRYLEEDWGYGADGRIYAAPMLSLIDIDECVKELDRLIDIGVSLVHLRPGPIGGKSPAIPEHDPFWARCAEAGVGVVFHVSNSGYNRMFGQYWSEDPATPSHLQTPLQWALCSTERPITDTLTALTLHNLFGRHPELRVLSIENGSDWTRHLLKVVDKAVSLGRRGAMIGGDLPDKPSEVLREHLWVCPFPEDDVVDLIEVLGPEHVVFGSDRPHPEGLAEPKEFIDLLGPCDDATKRQVLRSNAATLLGLPDAAPVPA